MKKATQCETHVCCKSDVKTQKIAHYTELSRKPSHTFHLLAYSICNALAIHLIHHSIAIKKR